MRQKHRRPARVGDVITAMYTSSFEAECCGHNLCEGQQIIKVKSSPRLWHHYYCHLAAQVEGDWTQDEILADTSWDVERVTKDAFLLMAAYAFAAAAIYTNFNS